MRASKEMIEPLVQKKIDDFKTHAQYLTGIYSIMEITAQQDPLEELIRKLIELKAYRQAYKEAPNETILS